MQHSRRVEALFFLHSLAAVQGRALAQRIPSLAISAWVEAVERKLLRASA